MRINSIRKEKNTEDTTKIIVDLTIKGQQKDLWLITENENAKYFCTERCDGIIVMLLPELLLIGENIESDLPISEKLYYNLSKLMPALVDNSQGRFSNIEIRCPLSTASLRNERQKSATGMSFGIDSLYSYFSHRPESCHGVVPRDYVVELITFFNNGSLNGEYRNNQQQMRAIFARGRERVIRFAERQNVDYLTVDTNIDEFYTLNYTKTHTFRTIGIVLCFQRLIVNYYFASSYKGGTTSKSIPTRRIHITICLASRRCQPRA